MRWQRARRGVAEARELAADFRKRKHILSTLNEVSQNTEKDQPVAVLTLVPAKFARFGEEVPCIYWGFGSASVVCRVYHLSDSFIENAGKKRFWPKLRPNSNPNFNPPAEIYHVFDTVTPLQSTEASTSTQNLHRKHFGRQKLTKSHKKSDMYAVRARGWEMIPCKEKQTEVMVWMRHLLNCPYLMTWPRQKSSQTRLLLPKREAWASYARNNLHAMRRKKYLLRKRSAD